MNKTEFFKAYPARKSRLNPIFYIDFYKVGHIKQYRKGIKRVFSNWTQRTTRVPGTTHVVNFGLTYFIKEYLQFQFQENFFNAPLADVLAEYRDVIRTCLLVADPETAHIEALHKLGYLPIAIYALPEGDLVPLGVPPVVVVNTHEDFFWLPNYIETLLSCIMWKPATSATTARRFRQLFLHHAKRSGETDFSFVDWQGHDFSFRGMAGVEDAILSGMGHLLSFSGTDTIPAILAARDYYGAKLSCGGSVPATEHSVMSAGGQDGEFETFKRLLTETYPTGIVSVVSDTWDLWKVLTDYIPRLKFEIRTRLGKLVIRPDSGDPVNIICGDPTATGPAREGTLLLLAQALGVGSRPDGGLPLINSAGAIYGDSISVERADQILTRTIDELKLSPYNMVFGIGSYTYEYVTRDTHGMAMKATAVQDADGVQAIWKKPVTDNGGKFSAKGILAVYKSEVDPQPGVFSDYYLVQNATEDMLNNCAYEHTFINGDLYIDPSFDVVRERARA